MLLLRGQATPSLASPSAAKQGRSPSGLPPPLSFSYPCEALSLKVLRLWGGGVWVYREGVTSYCGGLDPDQRGSASEEQAGPEEDIWD